MEIIIDENEAINQVAQEQHRNFFEPYTRLYWGSDYENHKYFEIERTALAKAINSGSDFIITIKNVTNSHTVEVSHKFKAGTTGWRGRYILQPESDKITANVVYTSIKASVNEFGPQTVFKFRFSIYSLLKLISLKATLENDTLKLSNGLHRSRKLVYTLGQDETNDIFLMLFSQYRPVAGEPIPSGTVSGGVKIPGGAQAE